jgi:hypothetical protein
VSLERADQPAGFSVARKIHHLKLPAQHVIDVERKRVVVTFGSRLTVEDIARYTRLLQANAAFHPSFCEIVDLRQVEQLDLKADDFLQLADQIDPFSPDTKRAFVVQTSVQEHAARMHKVLRAPRNIRIFRSLEEADRWMSE